MKSYFAWCRSDRVAYPNPPFEFRCLASSWEDAVDQAYKAHSNVDGFWVLDCFEETEFNKAEDKRVNNYLGIVEENTP